MEKFELPNSFEDGEDEETISREAEEASKEYKRHRTLADKLYSLSKAKEARERDELNWVQNYLQEIKNYRKRTALRITIRIAEIKSYSLRVIQELKERLDDYFFEDF